MKIFFQHYRWIMENNPRKNGSANKDPKGNTEVTPRLRPTGT
jgi:hypothetical protein